MKNLQKYGIGKGIFLAVIAVIVMLSSCSKSGNPTPVKKDPTIVAGTYKVTRNQGSDNGDGVYYDRPVVDGAITFAVTATHLTIKTPTSTLEYDWSYNSSTGMLTATHGGVSSQIKIESLSLNGFIWNAIATGVDNSRLTLVLE